MSAFVGSVVVTATAEQVYALWADATSWSAWDPDLSGAEIHGPFAVGSTGRIQPKSGPATKIRLTKVEPGRAFDAEASLPLCTMRFEHWCEPEGTRTRVTHRVTFHGAMAPFFRKLIGPSLRKGIPGTMAGLKAEVERRAAR
jgi:hypothetical protein